MHYAVACEVAVCAGWPQSGTGQQAGAGLVAHLRAPSQGCSPRTAHTPDALRGWGSASMSTSIAAPMLWYLRAMQRSFPAGVCYSL
jgi:hypothetical protein